ncbi:hypothetical protein [Streptomyces sp. NPDC053720]|uniref:hypothetical protein n=1 Tax=Streptomyces sp. NPDC053720 TaxID=3154855 RepID=UPI00342FF7E0
MTAGAATACSDNDSAPEHAASSSSSATSSTSPGAGQSGVSKLHMVTHDGHRLAFHVTRADKPENRQIISTAEGFAPAHKAFHEVTWPDAVPVTVMVSEKTPLDGSPVDAQRWRDAAASFAQDGPNRTLVTAKGSSYEVPKDRPTSYSRRSAQVGQQQSLLRFDERRAA